MGKIYCKCKTSLDNYDVSEITELCVRPMIGDYVLVLRGSVPMESKLRIMSITHSKGTHSDGNRICSHPILILELNV